ncbi:SAM-dependent methyltransferase [Niveispirillum lacus]|uniref:SAM-dependent methyltransferase n=1 Tax=Niveispirillum lacus TaxID=1981099 RepID=A0A255Z298_9PROT|nr:DUF938 domain-containing protein [Niveispirillum lacus]OYQ35034.1 SAM-dependent methyltransferase [Niveispirillum lacus]
MTDEKRHAPATLRNRQPLLEALRPHLPNTGLLLEIASGSGEHAVFLAENLPGLVWQPSDRDADALSSIRAWMGDAALPNIQPPLLLDAGDPRTWPDLRPDAILCVNMIHIAPWSATLGLFAGAASLLRPGAPLCLYGPYKRAGQHTAESNAAFDADLRARDPAWGVRDLEAVAEVAVGHGFAPPVIVEMPANNLTVIFRKAQ